MTDSALWPIQQAIYTLLTGDTTLIGKVAGVYDYVPANTKFPYVVIGEYTSNPYRTMSRYGEEDTVTLHIWSRYAGYKEALSILDDLNRLLADNPLTVTGWDTVACWYDFSDNFIDSDGVTRHVVVRYRIKTQKSI